MIKEVSFTYLYNIVIEFTLKYIFNKLEKELRTPPLNGLILPGITRDSILQISRQWGRYKVTEDVFTMTDVVQLVQEGRVSYKL